MLIEAIICRNSGTKEYKNKDGKVTKATDLTIEWYEQGSFQPISQALVGTVFGEVNSALINTFVNSKQKVSIQVYHHVREYKDKLYNSITLRLPKDFITVADEGTF